MQRENILDQTGCQKQCSYSKYSFSGEKQAILILSLCPEQTEEKKLKSSCVQATSLKSDNNDFILSLFAFSNFTTVETEQLIYPLSSLVKYTCNVSEESWSMKRDKEK